MEHLTAVMYRSQSVQPMDPGQLDRLLTASRAYNAMVNVSGVLLHDRGTFLQYFEGPTEAVEQVYARIRDSRLHAQMVQLMSRSVSKRQFASWHMGFSAAPTTVLEEIANENWNAVLPTVRDTPDQSPGLQLLLDYWQWATRPPAD